MTRRPAHGIVSNATLDLRRRPDHRSELRSQLLLGEVVRVLALSRDQRWWFVENREDRYRGWIRSWGVLARTRNEIAAWERRARGRVIVPHAELRSRELNERLGPLFWRSRLVLGRRRGRFREVEVPDGRIAVAPAMSVASGPRSRPRLERRVRDLLGVPYLWGGRTPLALDCSGFTQLVLGEQGILLPRDADDQCSACDPLSAGSIPSLGDLAFFGLPRKPIGHVGLALGRGLFAHARGTVRINSFIEGNQLYDQELARQLRVIGRPRKGRGWRVKTGQKPPESA